MRAAACCTSHACCARQVWDDQHLPNVDFSLICTKLLPGVLQGAYTVQVLQGATGCCRVLQVLQTNTRPAGCYMVVQVPQTMVVRFFNVCSFCSFVLGAFGESVQNHKFC